jgi:uncharacterized cupin superfamily protein
MNRSGAPMRYLMVGAHASPDIVVYPDANEFAAFAKDEFSVRLPVPEG